MSATIIPLKRSPKRKLDLDGRKEAALAALRSHREVIAAECLRVCTEHGRILRAIEELEKGL